MTFRVGLQFTADAKAAKAEVDGLAATVHKAGVEAEGLSTKGTKAKAATEGLGKAAVRADAQFSGLKTEIASLKATIDTMTAAETRAVTQMGALAAKAGELEARLGRGGRGSGGTGAAGSMGNLVANFNDLGVMMMAGQNPLQLAIQQGTQITQVIGPMGAGGAVKALGGAFLGMLNPINLIVIGSIAAGAAMLQWLTSASSEALTVEDQIKELTEQVNVYRQAAQAAAATDLFSNYGTQAQDARQFLEIRREIARIETEQALVTSARAASAAFPDFGGMSSQGLARNVAEINRLSQAYADLQGQIDLAATNGTDDATRARMNTELYLLRDRLEQLSGTSGKIAQVADILSVGREEAALFVQEILRLGEARGPEEAAAASQQLALHLADATDNFRLASDETKTLGKNLLEVVMAGMEFANLDLSTGIYPAVDAARTLADNLGIALGAALDLQAAMAVAQAVPGRGLEIPGATIDNPDVMEVARTNELTALVRLQEGARQRAAARASGGAGAGSSGGGGASAREERDAVAELIKWLQEEAAIRAELDPVQKEMIRYREELSGATAAQRAEVEALIEAEQREADAAEATQERWQYLRQTAYDALLTMAKGGDDASDALRNLGASLAEAVFQAAILGEGPLGSLFGGTSIFGLIGGALGLGGGGAGGGSAGIGGLAKGGYITGPGDGTSDSILMYGSSGEMMMNARAVRKNRHLLEAMNANAPVGYARGGMIGAGPGSGPGGGASGQPVVVSMKIDVTGARGNTEIMQMVRAGVEQGMAHYDRSILPSSVQRISADSRRIG